MFKKMFNYFSEIFTQIIIPFFVMIFISLSIIYFINNYNTEKKEKTKYNIWIGNLKVNNIEIVSQDCDCIVFSTDKSSIMEVCNQAYALVKTK